MLVAGLGLTCLLGLITSSPAVKTDVPEGLNNILGERIETNNQVGFNNQILPQNNHIGSKDRMGFKSKISYNKQPKGLKNKLQGPLGLSHRLTGNHGINKLRSLTALRSKRSSQLIEECVSVGLQEGGYYHKSMGENGVCGVYVAGGPNQRVQLTMEYMDVGCEEGGLISFLDGWELNGEVFPPVGDVPLEGRVQEYCGRHQRISFTSTSNAASMLYLMPRRGDVFKLNVKFIKNRTPCNILVNGDSGVFTLRNHGTRSNCSLAAVYPASISLLQLAVGVPVIKGIRRAAPNRFAETGVMHRCSKRGLEDEVVVGGSLGLDVSNMLVEDDICGLDSNPRARPSSVLCEVSVVRLISSGNTENSVTVALARIAFEDPNFLPTTVCPLPVEM